MHDKNSRDRKSCRRPPILLLRSECITHVQMYFLMFARHRLGRLGGFTERHRGGPRHSEHNFIRRTQQIAPRLITLQSSTGTDAWMLFLHTKRIWQNESVSNQTFDPKFSAVSWKKEFKKHRKTNHGAQLSKKQVKKMTESTSAFYIRF